MNKDSRTYEKGILNQERFKQYLFGIDRSDNESQSFIFNQKLLRKELELHRCTIEKRVA